MSKTQPRPAPATTAPQPFRDALAELTQIGMRVARMVGHVADAETALAEAAAQASVAEGASPLAASLAEAIEADRAAAAAAEARQTVVARTEAVAAAFAEISRGVRLTIQLAERLDRGWARGGAADGRQSMTRRQIARAVAEAIARAAEGERAASSTGRLTERLDTEAGLGNRSTEDIIAIICRKLGLDPVRMTLRSPLPNIISPAEMDAAFPSTAGGPVWQAPPPPRRPDG